jgi:hypothetical protein
MATDSCKQALAQDAELTSIITWLKEAEARKARCKPELLRHTRSTKTDESKIRAMIAALPQVPVLLADTSPEGRSAIYAALDVRMTYLTTGLVKVTANAAGALGNSYVSEGGLEPLARPLQALRK